MNNNILACVLMAIILLVASFIFIGCKKAVPPNNGGTTDPVDPPVDPPAAGEYKPYFRVSFNEAPQNTVSAKGISSRALTINGNGIPTWTVQYQDISPHNYNLIQQSENESLPVVNYFKAKFDVFAPSGVQGYDTAEHVNVQFWDIVANGVAKDDDGLEVPASVRLYRAGEEDSHYNIDYPFDMMTLRNPLIKLSNQKFLRFDEIRFRFFGNLAGLMGNNGDQIYAATYRVCKDREPAKYIALMSDDTSMKNPRTENGKDLFYFPSVNTFNGDAILRGITGRMFPFNAFWTYPDTSKLENMGRHGTNGNPFVEVIYTTNDVVTDADGRTYDITQNPAMIDVLSAYWNPSLPNGGGLDNVIVPTYYIHMDAPITFSSDKVVNINIYWNPVLEKRKSNRVNSGVPVGEFYTWPLNDPIPIRLEVYYTDLTEEAKSSAVNAEEPALPTDTF